MAIVSISNGTISAAIKTLGAELTSLKDASGCERLWQGDPKWWHGQAPVLFPIAGGLKDDKYTLNGVEYHLKKHGFAKSREFAVERQDAASATLLLAGEATKDEGYPFEYELRVRFACEGASLKVEYIVNNVGDGDMYYAIGGHEAYNCPEGIEKYDVVFDSPETVGIHPVVGTLIAPETTPLLANEAVLPLKEEYFDIDALVFTDHKSRALELKNRVSGKGVKVEFPGFDFLLLWHASGSPFMCVEPWTCVPDYTTGGGEIAEKPGMVKIAAGKCDARTHIITILG